ncbi:tyrosine-type recombinase/integrase [Alkalibacterium sp. s-m-22]
MLLNQYISYCEENGNRDTTLKRKKSSIERFLVIYSVKDSHTEDIMNFVQNYRGKSYYALKRELDEIKKFFDFCMSEGYIENNSTPVFPDIKATKTNKLPSIYSNDEINIMLNYIKRSSSIHQKRDYAIAFLIATLGFRSIDIANLSVTSLNFEDKMISFVQSKTRTTIKHHLSTPTINALVDYLLNERVESQSNFFFLKSTAERLSSKTVSGIIRKAFENCGIELGDRRRGSHCLRHSLASNLLNEGESMVAIANILGQTSAETTRLYTKIDIKHLVACALEVPDYEY